MDSPTQHSPAESLTFVETLAGSKPKTIQCPSVSMDSSYQNEVSCRFFPQFWCEAGKQVSLLGPKNRMPKPIFLGGAFLGEHVSHKHLCLAKLGIRKPGGGWGLSAFYLANSKPPCEMWQDPFGAIGVEQTLNPWNCSSRACVKV